MRQLSRRRVLTALGATALTLAARPVPVLAGLLDKLFSQAEAKPTKPITPNEEFYLTSYRSPPTIRVNDWSLSIKGSSNDP
jgi:hypothetical protein